MSNRNNRLPLWLKIGFTAWMLVWVPSFAGFYGPRNFLWMCDLCNFIFLLALWKESKLLVSSQLVSVLVVDLLWTADVAWAAFFHSHPIGGTEYMWNPEIPLHIRLMSLYHAVVPAILIWTTVRLGYDRRGIYLQTAIALFVLPLSFLLSTPEWDINWVYGLFGEPQTAMNPVLYMLIHTFMYPIIVFLPTHLLILLTIKARDTIVTKR